MGQVEPFNGSAFVADDQVEEFRILPVVEWRVILLVVLLVIGGFELSFLWVTFFTGVLLFLALSVKKCLIFLDIIVKARQINTLSVPIDVSVSFLL